MNARKIEIHFPAHVQRWAVTPHGGELAGTARKVPEAPPPGQEAKSPDLPRETILQPRAEPETKAIEIKNLKPQMELELV